MIQGIGVEVTFEPPVPFTDEWLDAVYISLEKNMAIVSIDMFVDEAIGKIRLTLWIDNAFESEDFCEEVAKEAIEKAFADAAGPNVINEKNELTASKVAVFA